MKRNCLVLLVLAILVFSSCAQPPTPTPPPIPMTLYESTEHGFSIEYPEGWTEYTEGAGTMFVFEFIDPEGRLTVDVYVEYKAEEIILADHVTEGKAYVESMPQYELLSEGYITTGEGISGYEIVGKGDLGTGKVEKLRYVVLVREKQGFWVGVRGEPTDFDQQEQIIDAVVNSFKLLSTYTFVPPTPTPTLATLPEEILASRFGICSVGQGIDEITRLGIRWTKPYPNPSGPFIWGSIERERGEYTWQLTDTYVQKIQGHNMAFLAVIWPFTEWDQSNWGTAPAGTSPIIYEQWLGRSRRKPYDMDAYRRFVSALVERYDGDGIGDMPGLRYPIKHWQAGLVPAVQEGYFTFFNGSSEDYLEVMKATYQTVKEADPEAKVLQPGMLEMTPHCVSFWEPIFEKGSQYFDIANVHVCWPLAELGHAELDKTGLIAMAEGQVSEFKKLLSEYGIDKPIWVTAALYYFSENVSPEEFGQILVRSYVISFASGVDKFFYDTFRPFPFDEPFLKRCTPVDENGEKRPAYYGLKTLIEKLDKFTSAEKLAEGQYRFMVEGKTVHVLWGSGEIPEEITGEVLVTDIYGKETRTDSSAISLTESPTFVESAHSAE